MNKHLELASEAITTFLDHAADKGWFLTEGANDGSTWTVDHDDVERLKAAVVADVQAAYDAAHQSVIELEQRARQPVAPGDRPALIEELLARAPLVRRTGEK